MAKEESACPHASLVEPGDVSVDVHIVHVDPEARNIEVTVSVG